MRQGSLTSPLDLSLFTSAGFATGLHLEKPSYCPGAYTTLATVLGNLGDRTRFRTEYRNTVFIHCSFCCFNLNCPCKVIIVNGTKCQNSCKHKNRERIVLPKYILFGFKCQVFGMYAGVIRPPSGPLSSSSSTFPSVNRGF